MAGSSNKYQFQGKLDFDQIDFMGLLDNLDQGVLMTDMDGVLVYYNEVQAKIDNAKPMDALGRKIYDYYEYDNDSSTCMRCIKHGHPIINYALSYRSPNAHVGNTIHSVFPLHNHQGDMIGTICFVKDYNILERTIPSFLMPRNNEIFAEGTQHTFANIIGSDPEFVCAIKTAKMASNSPSPVLLFGETGVGKELVAQSIHNFYYGKKGRYVAINCAAIPDSLIEGILFGTARGAYTGAVERAGLFERASGGSIFLDEINSMPISLQGKLLRVLQENEVRRVGAVDTIRVNVKVISSMNINPKDAVRQGILRMDLYYRLAVIAIQIPPLRSRKWDIEELTRHFILKYNNMLDKNAIGVSSKIIDLFYNYDWPGNVRELEHVIESAINMIAPNEDLIDFKHLHFHLDHLAQFKSHEKIRVTKNKDFIQKPQSDLPCGAYTTGQPMHNGSEPNDLNGDIRQLKKQLEIEKLSMAINTSGGNIAKAARSLGISRQLMHYKIKKYNIKRM